MTLAGAKKRPELEVTHAVERAREARVFELQSCEMVREKGFAGARNDNQRTFEIRVKIPAAAIVRT